MSTEMMPAESGGGTPKTIKGAFYKFCLSSTVRGIPKIVKEPSYIWRVIWFLTVLSFLAIAAYFTSSSINSYFQYHETMMEKFPKTEVNYFPKVTICDTRDITQKFKTEWKEFSDKIVPKLNAMYKGAEQIYYNQTGESVTITSPDEQRIFSRFEFVKYIESNGNTFLQLDEKYRNFIFNCTYIKPLMLKKELTPCVIERYHLLDGTVCYEVDRSDLGPGGTESTQLELQVILYFNNILDNSENKPSGEPARVYLEGSRPLAITDVLFGEPITPGFLKSLSVNVLIQKRGTTPVNPCEMNALPLQTSSGQYYNYSSKHCASFCTQNTLAKKCHRTYPHLPVPVDLPQGILSISSYNQTPMEYLNACYCIASTESCKSKVTRKEICLDPCEFKKYRSLKWDRTWPSRTEQIDIYRNYIRNSTINEHFLMYENISNVFMTSRGEAIKMLHNLTLMEENFAQVSVSLAQEDVRIVEYQLLDTWVSLLSKVGGQLSLWVGVTFIAGVEIIHLLCDIIMVCIDSARKKRGRTTVKNGGVYYTCNKCSEQQTPKGVTVSSL